MELHQLVSFVAVAEEGNMRRATSRLHVSQPAVSAHIKALEEECGIALFTRTQQGMELTPEGLRLKEKADAVLRGVEAFGQEAQALRGGIEGDIVLGVNTDPRLVRLKEIHAALVHAAPKLSLVVRETMSWDVVQELAARHIDLGFAYTFAPDDRVVALPLGAVALTVVAPDAWRERLSGATMRDIAAYPWVWASEHCPLNRVLVELFETLGATPEKAVVVDQEAAILKLVADGVGLGVMPVAKVQEVGNVYGVFPVLPLEGSLTLHLLCLARRRDERGIAAMLKVVLNIWDIASPCV